MDTTHASTLVIGPREAGGLRVTFEGRTAWLGVVGTPAELRESAERLEAEATERLWRARRARVLADVLQAQAEEAAQRAATQRRERAAATRAHNRDPFGFLAQEALRRRYERDECAAPVSDSEDEGR